MNYDNLELAYAIQRKFLQNKEISAYKVGASNLTSKNFFNTNNIIIGGIEEKNIYKNEIKKKLSRCRIRDYRKDSIQP